MLVLRTVVLGLVAALLVGPGPDSAGAMSSVAPVTVDDVIVMTPLMYVDADVLANDHDPDGGNLQVCRFDSPADVALRLRIVSRSGIPGENGIIKPGSTRIDVSLEEGFHAGDYSIPYYACDRSHLTPATLTLQVRDFTAQAVAGQPRVVRFTNPLDQAALVYWAPPGAEDISGSQHLEAGQSRDVDVHGGKVQWVASLAATEGEGDDLVPIAYGTIRADGLPRPSVLPSIANPHVSASDDLVPPRLPLTTSRSSTTTAWRSTCSPTTPTTVPRICRSAGPTSRGRSPSHQAKLCRSWCIRGGPTPASPRVEERTSSR